jgi:hypothetical protein
MELFNPDKTWTPVEDEEDQQVAGNSDAPSTQ